MPWEKPSEWPLLGLTLGIWSLQEARKNQIKPFVATRRPVGAQSGPTTTPEGPSKNGHFRCKVDLGRWGTTQSLPVGKLLDGPDQADQARASQPAQTDPDRARQTEQTDRPERQTRADQTDPDPARPGPAASDGLVGGVK